MAWFKKSKSIKKNQKADSNPDFNKELKRNVAVSNLAEQQDFFSNENIDTKDTLTVSSPKKGLSCNLADISSDQVQILRSCALESSAEALIKILKRTNKSRFKNDILNPLLACDFFQRTIPEKPKSPKQKYRLTDKFVRAKLM
ncbi:Fic family protein [Candidatus Thioglobus sp.]|uniref:Fic family protein n=1 Tax=Candidatus Thioglobus sp. TaxID=2026721 RepID=UPI003D09B58B